MAILYAANGTAILIDDEDYDWLNSYKWFISKFGYVVRNERKTQVRLHRQIMRVSVPEYLVDHINMDRLDNRKDNLRICTHQENLQNRGKPITNTSGYKGVSFAKKLGKWQAKIGFKGNEKGLGYYETPEEAHEVYCLWADMLHGVYANHGGG